jgi:hypothetical protein
MINDYIEVQSGQVIDLGLEIDLVVNKNESQTEIIKSIIREVTSFFSIDKRKMGDPLLVGELQRVIGNVAGVVNVVDIRVYNLVGGNYSSTEISQSFVDPTTREILQIDKTIFMKSNQIFQIRFPNSDVKIRTKTLKNTTY